MGKERRHKIPDQEWESQKNVIRRLYIEEDRKLEGSGGLIDVMEKEYNFSASKAQFETRLKKWNFNKYSTSSRIGRSLERRPRAFCKGRPVTSTKNNGNIRNSKMKCTQQRLLCGANVSLSPMSQVQLSDYALAGMSSSLSATPNTQYRVSVSPPRAPVTTFGSTFDPTASSVMIYQPDPFAGQRDLSPSWHRPESFAYDIDATRLGLLSDDLSGIECFNRWPEDSSITQIEYARPSDSLVIEDLASFPTLFQAMSSLSQGFPTFQHALRQIDERVNFSKFPWEQLYPLRTCHLIRKQSHDFNLIFLVVSRLVNDPDIVVRLHDPITAVDKSCRVVLETLFRSGENVLKKFLRSVPHPYSRALETGILRAAVELGAAKSVEFLLKRGLDFNLMGYKLDAFASRLLKRSCRLLYVDITRVLLKYGADPEYILCNLHGYLEIERTRGYATMKPSMDTVKLLLNAKTGFDAARLFYIIDFCDAGMLKLLFTKIKGSGFELFFFQGGLPKILRRRDTDGVDEAVSVILEHEYPESVEHNDIWHQALAISLSNAISLNREVSVELLLGAGARPNSNCLIKAVQARNTGMIQRFLDLGADANAQNLPTPQDPNDLGKMELGRESEVNCAAMSVAILEGYHDVLEIFEQRDFISKIGYNRKSFGFALEAACERGEVGLVRDMISTILLSYENVDDAIEAALRGKQEQIVQEILDTGIPPGNKSLRSAIFYRNESLVTMIMDIALIFSKRRGGKWFDILQEAIAWGNLSIIRTLIPMGVSLNNEMIREDLDTLLPTELYGGTIAWRCTPLSLAIAKGDQTIVEFLLDSGAQLNVHDPYLSMTELKAIQLTALSASIARQDLDLCKKLLVLGADPFDNSALLIAVMMRNKDLVYELLETHANQYSARKSGFGAEALLLALEENEVWWVNFLAKHTDLDHPVLLCRCFPHCTHEYHDSSRLMSPLGKCIGYSKTPDFLRTLLDNAADPNSTVWHYGRFNDRKTALLYAIERTSLEKVKMLVEAGAFVTSKTTRGSPHTPLQSAALSGQEAIVQYLLQQGADPNEDPFISSGATALQLAASRGHIGIASILLEHGANINAEPAKFVGRTAFEGAAEFGRIEMMLFLVQNGADLLSNDSRQYKRAIAFAEEWGQPAAKEFADQLYQAALKQETSRIMASLEGPALTEPDGFIFDEFS